MIASTGGGVQTGGIQAQVSGRAGDIVGGDKIVYVGTTPTISALHQLPSPPADFTGREEDLAALRSALTQGGTSAILVIRGIGGVGKTVLALKLAEELTPRYPDAQFYLDLKGVDPQPLTVAQAMAHIVRSFYPETRIPEIDTELAPLYRSVLHGKRCLLLMDNAANREQVEPLIPPPGSLLLVTSRFRFTLPGLVSRDLDEMSPEDARDLLLRIAPRIGKEADEIARLCGRLSLALRLVGSTLAERPDLRPSEYGRRLREGKERLDPVEASLSLSYELLAEDRQRFWRLLSVFPGAFDAPAAAAVWELEIDPARDALWDLVRCSLIEWEEEKKYRLHDLARQFADRRLKPDERDAAQRRHAGYFSEVLPAVRPHPRERIRWLEQALTKARQQKNRAREAFHLGNLGLAYADLGEIRRAIESYEQVLAIAREIADRRGEGIALGNLGNTYAALGETRRALEFYEQHLTIARDIGDRWMEGQTLGNLGNAYVALGETRHAIEFYEQHLAIARDVGDRRGESIALGNLGNAYAALGETRRAMEFYEHVLAIAREIGDRRGEAITIWNLGKEVEKTGDFARAAELMEVLVDYQREIGHPDAEKRAAQVEALRARLAEQGS